MILLPGGKRIKIEAVQAQRARKNLERSQRLQKLKKAQTITLSNQHSSTNGVRKLRVKLPNTKEFDISLRFNNSQPELKVHGARESWLKYQANDFQKPVTKRLDRQFEILNTLNQAYKNIAEISQAQ